MDPREKEMLEKTYSLAKENTRILKGMQRKERIHNVFRFIKWAVIIGIFIWTYSLLQPILEQMRDVYTGVQETTSTVKELKETAGSLQDKAEIGNLLELFGVSSE